MAHVQIKAGQGVSGMAQVIIDGVDVSMDILARNFKVNIPEEQGGLPTVTVEIAADVLEVDLPDAVVEAMRADAEVDV